MSAAPRLRMRSSSEGSSRSSPTSGRSGMLPHIALRQLCPNLSTCVCLVLSIDRAITAENSKRRQSNVGTSTANNQCVRVFHPIASAAQTN